MAGAVRSCVGVGSAGDPEGLAQVGPLMGSGGVDDHQPVYETGPAGTTAETLAGLLASLVFEESLQGGTDAPIHHSRPDGGLQFDHQDALETRRAVLVGAVLQAVELLGPFAHVL